MATTFEDDFPLQPEVEAGMDPRYVAPVMVGFAMRPLKDEAKTKEAGHEVYVDVEHVKIAIPGDRLTLYEQPATDSHRKRFPQAYAAFKNRNIEVKEGLPLEHWAPVPRSMVMTFKAAHIHTVEALAALHDGHVDKFGYMARKWRDMAQKHLEMAKDTAAQTRIADENRRLQEQLAAMQEQIAALAAAKSGDADESSANRRKAK